MRTHTLLIALIVAATGATTNAQPKAQVAAPDAAPRPAAQPVPAHFDREAPVPASPFQSDLTPGYVLIEGDIQIRLDQYLALQHGLDSTFGGVTYWFSGIVPYDFVTSGGGAVSAANQNAAIGAMNAIAARAGVTFRPATGSDVNRIRFQNSSFNNSPVGLQGGTQIINIFNWNVQIIMCHELYHSLGFWHEQSRTDRASFITVNNANICGTAGSGVCSPAGCCLCVDNASNCTSCLFNFNVSGTSLLYGLYDFDSFMHYGRTAFSCNNADTITVVPAYNAAWQDVIGQRDHFSYYDRITCRGLYPFNTDRWLDHGNFGTQSGTFLQPENLAFLTAASVAPAGGTLFVKFGGTYSAVGTYTNPLTIEAPNGVVTLGN